MTAAIIVGLYHSMHITLATFGVFRGESQSFVARFTAYRILTSLGHHPAR